MSPFKISIDIACTIPSMLTELSKFYSLQVGDAPLHLAALGGHSMCVERILSTPGIDVNIGDEVSYSIGS